MKNTPKNIDDYFTPPDIHDAQHKLWRGHKVCLLAAVLCATESLLAYTVAMGTISVTVGLSLHTTLMAILGLYAYQLQKRGHANPFIYLLFLTTATTGPFGAGGVLLTVMTYAWFSRHSHSFDEWFTNLFPPTTETISQHIYADMVMGRDESGKSYSVIPFLDVLSFGDDEQKRQALAKMTSHFHPNFAAAFKKALADPSNMIRVQAATSISRIETQFMDRMIKLTHLMERHKDDSMVILAVAQHCDDYAYTGLLDSERELDNRVTALQYYHKYLQLKPDNLNVRSHIGRLLMRNKQYTEAYNWLKQCIDKGYTSDAIAQWYSEILFSCGRYEELRRYRAGLPPSQETSQLQPALKEALALWSGGVA